MSTFPSNLFLKKQSSAYNIKLAEDEKNVGIKDYLHLICSSYQEIVNVLDQLFETSCLKSNTSKAYVDIGCYRFISNEHICKTYIPIIHLVITEGAEEKLKHTIDNRIEHNPFLKITSFSGAGSAFSQSNRKLFKRYSVKRKLYE